MATRLNHVDARLARVLRHQEQIITRWQALQYLSVKTMRHLVESGRWRRHRDGLFIAHTGELTPSQRSWLAVLGAGGDRRPESVCLAGLSALRAWGLRSVEAPAIHLLVPENHPVRRRPGIVVHRTRVPPDLGGSRHLRPVASLPGRSLVDAVQWARSDREAVLIVAAAFQQRLVVLADIERTLDEIPNATRGPLLRRTAADCASGAHSVAEHDLVALCRRHRLPEPTRQVARLDRQGRRRYLDAVFEPWAVVVEVDGVHHLDVAQAWDDAIRANALELDGFVVLRYPAHVVRTDSARVAAEIRAALRRAGWTGEAA